MASVAAGERHTLARSDAVSSPAPLLRSDPNLSTEPRTAPSATLSFASVSRASPALTRLGEGHAFAAAFRDAMGVTLAEFEGDFSRRLSAVAVSR